MTDYGVKRMSPVIATLLAVLILTTPAGAQDKPRGTGAS